MSKHEWRATGHAYNFAPFLFILGLWIILPPSKLQAADRAGNAWALLIGVERYEKVVPLQFTVNDVRQLSETLGSYGGYQARHILELTDNGEAPDSQPYAKTLKERLPQWLAKPATEDSMLVFFSGHGFQADDGKMYLAPLDFDKSKAAETGLSVEWLRDQIEKCPAKFKLLIIDSCHAGSEKNVTSDDIAMTAAALGQPFESVAGVVTLASCKAEEKSQIWFGKQRSLYSYWLTEGLKGHADRDSDGNVDIDELHRYVDRRVRHTAEVRFARPQTPVRMIGPRVIGVPEVVHLRPQPLRMLLANISEHLANLMEENQLAKVGVLEFSDDSRLQEVLGGNFGLLGKYCGDEVERQLTFLSQDSDFRIVDRNQLRTAMQKQGGFKLSDLSTPVRLVSLAKDAAQMQVIALGSIRGRQGPILRLQCELKDTQAGDLIGITGGTAELNEDEWAMLGESVMVRQEDRLPPSLAESSGQVPTGVIERLDERAEAGHVLQDPEFLKQFNVQIRVNGQSLQPVFRGNECIVGMHQGDVYRVRVENNSGELVLMRVLVDGLDTTLKVADKGLATELWASPVRHLDEAGYLYLDPQGDELKGGPPVWEIYGFTVQTGEKGRVRQFEVVDASDSLAGRQGFTEQVGMITVAFYEPASGTRDLGTAAGEELELAIGQRQGPRPGNLIGVAHIRYLEAEALEQLRE